MGYVVIGDGIPYTKAQDKAWRDVVLKCTCGHSDSVLVWDEIVNDSAEDINYFAALNKMKEENQEHIKHKCFIGLGVA